jgi:alcohol dehydrogenase class IV
MTMNFEFATASKIVFGQESHKKIGHIAQGYGHRCLVVTGTNLERAKRLLNILDESKLVYSTYSVQGEPTIDQIEAGIHAVKAFQGNVVIGFGGGSVIDSAKAIAGLATNPGRLLEYLEVIGDNKPLSVPALPCIAIPTTAGTGAEVTKNAVLTSQEHRQKVSLRSPYLLPAVALVDSTLCHDLPPDLTANTGLDALTQLIEPYLSNRANPFTDALCLKGIECAKRSLKRCFQNGTDAPAREEMSLASLFGGIALANAGLGAVHGFAGAIGGMFHAPHGAICAALLPFVMQANIHALQKQDSQHPYLDRFRHLASLLTHSSDPEQAVQWVRNLCRDLQVKPLHCYGITQSDIPAIVQKSQKASSMKANPIVLSPEELTEILERAK